MSYTLSIILLSVTTAITCAFPGTFLVIKKQSMLVEAMSHAVLPGIVIGVLLTNKTHSPWMLLFASLMALLVVLAADKFAQTRLITSDAAQGIVFPVLFAIGIILLSTVLSSVVISEDTVLTGEINLMALKTEHLIMGGYDFGPKMMWYLLAVLALDCIYVVVCWQTLKLASFDPLLARSMGFPVDIVNLGLMILVALTVVVAFNTAGAILVVALMIVPPACAFLITHKLWQLIVVSQIIAAAAAIIGFVCSDVFNLATAPLIAFMNGCIFLCIFSATCITRALYRHKNTQRYKQPAS